MGGRGMVSPASKMKPAGNYYGFELSSAEATKINKDISALIKQYQTKHAKPEIGDTKESGRQYVLWRLNMFGYIASHAKDSRVVEMARIQQVEDATSYKYRYFLTKKDFNAFVKGKS